MPALYHVLPGHPFCLAKSEVVNWLCEQPEIRDALFNFYRSRGAIVFENACWRGADNDPAKDRELDDKIDKWITGFQED